MKSFDDLLDTVPIPVISTGEISDESEHEKSSTKSFVIMALGVVALSGLFYGTSVANIHDQVTRDVFEADRPPSNEQNYNVSELASTIVGTSVVVDCNTEKMNEERAESKDDTHTLAYVLRYTFKDFEYVPPIITMRGYLCSDLLTFPRMKQPDGEEPSVTYKIRAKEFAKAAAILLHENEHIHHEFDEGAATCYAVQKLPESIQQYYGSSEDAMAYSTDAVYDLSIELKPEYTSPDCKPGGTLDLGISSVYTTDFTVFAH